MRMFPDENGLRDSQTGEIKPWDSVSKEEAVETATLMMREIRNMQEEIRFLKATVLAQTGWTAEQVILFQRGW